MMPQGALTTHLDAVQLLVAGFFIFFLGLVFYLRREDKREGYPLVDISPRGIPIEGFPAAPPTKIYRLLDGSIGTMPSRFEPSAMRAAPLERHPGAPLVPLGDPMSAEVGPGAYPLRTDRPFTEQGQPQVQPMRTASGWTVAADDPDPRGMRVLDAARTPVGTVTDLWVDRGVKILRYLEVALDDDPAALPVLVPIFHTDIRGRQRVVRLLSMFDGYLRAAPRTRSRDQITAREEDQVNAYFAAASMYGRTPRDTPDAIPVNRYLPRLPG